MAALRMGVNRLLVGTVKTDSFHTDGTPRFVQAMNDLCKMQEGEICVEAPAIQMSSADLIRLSKVDISVLAWGHSCHVAPWACGLCRGCWKHRQVMQELGYGAY
jgi:7-cyano-7-deazaguanine synthase